jgi:predicted alpha/beta-hydrolase family hydrolase
MHTETSVIVRTDSVLIPAGGKTLRGDLSIPQHAQGIVVFVPGTGSSRLSNRTQYEARKLCTAGIATLLFDLMTEEEENEDLDTGLLRFDVSMLADRLVDIIEWLAVGEATAGLNIGLYGAYTGAATAILAAVRRSKWVNAVVCQAGRPDLVGTELGDLQCPTLLVVGSADIDTIKISKKAMTMMDCPTRLTLIQNASHMLDEPGALEQVTAAAQEWYLQHLI